MVKTVPRSIPHQIPSPRVISVSSDISQDGNGFELLNLDQGGEHVVAEVEKENSIQIEKCKKRHEIFENLITGNPSRETVSFKYGLYCILDFVLTLLATSVVVIIPMHNLILNPEYWYELVAQFLSGILPIGIARFIYDCSAWMNIDYIFTIRHYLILYMVSAAAFLTSMVGLNLVWVQFLENRFPMPFHVMVYALTMKAAELLLLWHFFPKSWRNDRGFLTRLKWNYGTIFIGELIGNLSYQILHKLFVEVPANYQWILALVLPFFKEFNIWTVSKLAGKASRGDAIRTKIACSYGVNLRHLMFLAVKVGTNSTNATTIYVLVVDFVANLYFALKIIYMRKTNNPNKMIQIDMLQALVLNELAEVMVPSVYLMVFILAYFGPNYDLIGNIGNDYWGMDAISDFKTTMENLVMFFFFDTCSFVACSLLLYLTTRINLLEACLHIRKEFGLMFSIYIVFQMNQVMNSIFLYAIFGNLTPLWYIPE